jgi:hypothetical protein
MIHTVGPRTAIRYEAAARKRRLLFVVSREQPQRYDSLAHAFSGDEEVKVIFDRRRGERRQRSQVPSVERRRRDRRSAIRAWAVGAVGWIRVAVAYC